jgi:SAM-dependent methyltransferase
VFFPEKIISINPQDRVLEVGPGGSPHPRSDAFLEFKFHTAQEKLAQRGNVVQEPSFGNRPVHYYEGGKFPFEDGAFNYVICSHVIEHVADPAGFLDEVFRVGKGRGYLEYPLITYEYLYNFNVHLHFMKFDFEERVLRFLPKSSTTFSEFSAVQAFFYKTLEYGWDDLCSSNKQLFFEGFEFNEPFSVTKACDVEKLLPARSLIIQKRTIRKRVNQLLNKLRL